MSPEEAKLTLERNALLTQVHHLEREINSLRFRLDSRDQEIERLRALVAQWKRKAENLL